MDQDYSEHIEERGGGIPGKRADADWNKQMVEGTVQRARRGYGGRSYSE